MKTCFPKSPNQKIFRTSSYLCGVHGLKKKTHANADVGCGSSDRDITENLEFMGDKQCVQEELL